MLDVEALRLAISRRFISGGAFGREGTSGGERPVHELEPVPSRSAKVVEERGGDRVPGSFHPAVPVAMPFITKKFLDQLLMDHQSDAALSLRYLNLKKSFQLGIRAVLTAFSKEDINRAFPSFTDAQRESLHRMFIQAIKSLHENIEEEFESICHETQVTAVLAMIEQLVEEQSLDILFKDKNGANLGDIKEKISVTKKDEVQCLTSMLEKAEEQNNALRARIDSLKKRQNTGSASSDVVEMLRRWNSNYGSFR
ncbi:hypothetical protein J5N97_024923 [Dioscorea zingiberensis]|uniref:Uncharacterized protein n=2 Tax=Magnoliopsida TaxID=3398 RepID=A0A9D5C7C6_9LILI|nr:hypothetical protein J5N97_024923 [Dioscorea zingiberensis]